MQSIIQTVAELTNEYVPVDYHLIGAIALVIGAVIILAKMNIGLFDGAFEVLSSGDSKTAFMVVNLIAVSTNVVFGSIMVYVAMLHGPLVGVAMAILSVLAIAFVLIVLNLAMNMLEELRIRRVVKRLRAENN